jgi:TonB family protein
MYARQLTILCFGFTLSWTCVTFAQSSQPPASAPSVAVGTSSADLARLAEQARLALAKRGIVVLTDSSLRFKPYLDMWNKRVDYFGNQHYPQAARKAHLRGHVELSTTVNRDGSLQAVEVLASSGLSVLDRAAVQAVKDAAPFATLSSYNIDADHGIIVRVFTYGER